jgi:hypothetical protein
MVCLVGTMKDRSHTRLVQHAHHVKMALDGVLINCAIVGYRRCLISILKQYFDLRSATIFTQIHSWMNLCVAIDGSVCVCVCV